MVRLWRLWRRRSKVVQRVATSYAGYGAYLERESEEQPRAGQFHDDVESSGIEEGDEVNRLIHGAASSYNLSASYFALIHPGAASLMFWAAARAYLRLRRVYGGALAVCARDRRLLRAYAELVSGHTHAPREIPYAGITLAALAQRTGPQPFRRELKRLIEAARPWRAALPSDVQIPVGVFLDVCEDLSTREQNSAQIWPRSVSVLLERFGEQFAAAQANSYRWNKLQERFLPVQPEVLASVILTREKFGPLDRRMPDEGLAQLQEQAAIRILLGVSDEIIETEHLDLERAFPDRRVPEAVTLLFQQWKEHRG